MVAHWFHKGQTDMAGRPYVEHLERVARPFQYPGFPVAETVAWLHDVVEDTDCTIHDLRQLGFSEDVCMAVVAITQFQGETLDDYWARVKANPIARAVKVKGDIPDNSDERRLDFLPEHLQVKLRNKYARAIAFLGYEWQAMEVLGYD